MVGRGASSNGITEPILLCTSTTCVRRGEERDGNRSIRCTRPPRGSSKKERPNSFGHAVAPSNSSMAFEQRIRADALHAWASSRSDYPIKRLVNIDVLTSIVVACLVVVIGVALSVTRPERTKPKTVRKTRMHCSDQTYRQEQRRDAPRNIRGLQTPNAVHVTATLRVGLFHPLAPGTPTNRKMDLL